jgi:hypothetical protein
MCLVFFFVLNDIFKCDIQYLIIDCECLCVLKPTILNREYVYLININTLRRISQFLSTQARNDIN